MNFNKILVGSDQPERLVEYYTRLFGSPGFEDGGYTGWQLGDGFISIGAHSAVHGPNKEPGRFILNIESDDVRADYERLVAAGAKVVREPYSLDEFPSFWIATLEDPDGNYFQLTTQFDPSMTGGANNA
jgi:predicted enzyme related to lactoylglutathione lyase